MWEVLQKRRRKAGTKVDVVLEEAAESSIGVDSGGMGQPARLQG